MHVVVLVTASSRKEADKIAKGLLKNKLAACINIVDRVNSYFWWQGEIDNAKESLLIIKSRKDKLAKLIKLVKSLHSYTVAEIIALPIVGGSQPYLNWINESIR